MAAVKKGRIQKAVEKKQADYILSKQSLDAMAKDSGQAMMIGQNPLFLSNIQTGFQQLIHKMLIVLFKNI